MMISTMRSTATALAVAASLSFAVSGAFAAGPELVSNGDFETGDFSGWTETPLNGATLYGVDGLGPHNGSYAAYFGALDPYDTISQTIATVAGTSYTVSFYLDNSDSAAGEAGFVGKFGSTTFISLTDADADFDFKPFSFTVTATSASTLLSFAGYNTHWYYTFDDVSVKAITAAVPEPSTYALMALGLAGIGFAARRKGRQAS